MGHGISVCMIPSSGVHWPHRRLHCYRVVENTLQTEACCSCAMKNCTKVSTRLGPTLREVLPCECLCPGPTRSQKHGPSGGEGDRGRHSPSRTGLHGTRATQRKEWRRIFKRAGIFTSAQTGPYLSPFLRCFRSLDSGSGDDFLNSALISSSDCSFKLPLSSGTSMILSSCKSDA